MDAEAQRQLETLLAEIAALDLEYYTKAERTREDHAEYQRRQEYLERLREEFYAGVTMPGRITSSSRTMLRTGLVVARLSQNAKQ